MITVNKVGNVNVVELQMMTSGITIYWPVRNIDNPLDAILSGNTTDNWDYNYKNSKLPCYKKNISCQGELIMIILTALITWNIKILNLYILKEMSKLERQTLWQTKADTKLSRTHHKDIFNI